MRKDSILQNFYNSKLPKAENGLGIRKPVEPYHPDSNPSGYKGKVNLNTLMEEAKKKPAKSNGAGINLNLPRIEQPNPNRLFPYAYNERPDQYANIFGVGAQGNLKLNDRLGVTGGANIQHLSVPIAGISEWQKPIFNAGVNYRFANGGDISIPDLDADKWLLHYQKGGGFLSGVGDFFSNIGHGIASIFKGGKGGGSCSPLGCATNVGGTGNIKGGGNHKGLGIGKFLSGMGEGVCQGASCAPTRASFIGNTLDKSAPINKGYGVGYNLGRFAEDTANIFNPDRYDLSFGNSNVCPPGQYYDANLNRCVSGNFKDGGPAYATGGVTCPTGQYWNGKQCVPFLPTGLEMAKQMRSPSTTGELEQLKSDVKGSDIARVNRATNKRQFVGPARASTPDSEAYRLATNKTYAAQNAPYTSIDESGNLSQAFPNASMTGTPLTGSELERKYKGIHHITKGLEAALYLTGAGELYKAGMIGTEALGAGASALESGEASGLSDVFWNGKSYQPTPLSNPRILSVQHGMDALPPGYNAHLWGRQGYVEPALEGPLAPYATTYDAEAPSVIWSDVNDQVKQNWFNKTPPKTSGFTWSPRGWFRDTPPVTPVTETTLEENLAAARNQAAGTKPPAAGKPGIKPKGKSSMWGKVGRGAAGIGLVTALPSLYRATMTSSIPESFSNMPVTGQSGDSTLGTTGVDTGAVSNIYDTSGIPTNVMDSNQYMNTPDTGATALPSHARGGMITDPRGQWAHPGQNTRIPGGNITMQGVPYPVLGRADTGQSIMMQPGQDYNFEGANHVDEYPMMRQGGFLPKAQNGNSEGMSNFMNSVGNKNCVGAAWHAILGNDAGGSSGAAAKVVPEWDEISTSKGYFNKDQIKGFEKEFKKNKELQTKYPGITIEEYIAAQRDADRTSRQFANPERAKYFDPQTGKLLPNVDPRSVYAFMRFYREKFPTQPKISAEDVLGVYGGMEGGLSNYKKYSNVGYQKPLKEGGQLHKLQQLLDFGNPPVARVGDYINNGSGFKQVVESNYGKKKAAYGGPLVDYYQGKMNHGEMFSKGGEYDMSDADIQNLIKQGYKIEYV